MMKALLVCAALACIFPLIYSTAVPDRAHARNSSKSSEELTNKTTSNRGSKGQLSVKVQPIFSYFLVERGANCGKNGTELEFLRSLPMTNGTLNGTILPIQPSQRNNGPLPAPALQLPPPPLSV